jgi:hypothetical protein
MVKLPSGVQLGPRRSNASLFRGRIGVVTPKELCSSQADQEVVLSPAAGTLFPPTPSSTMWTLILGTEAAEILSWSPTAIVINARAGLNGCYGVGWFHEAAAGQPATYVRVYDAELTIIGTPTVDVFAASKLNADSCEPVELSWQVELSVCRSSNAFAHVSIKRDGASFQDYLPTSGIVMVADATSTAYTLSVVSELGAQQCGTIEQTLTITRSPRMTITSSPTDYCVDQNSAVYFHIDLSCPAPDGGLEVLLQSDNPNVIPSTQVAVDAGQTSADVALYTSTICGTVNLIFQAPGYPDVSGGVSVVGVPQIIGLSRTDFSPCEDIVLEISGACLGNSTALIAAALVNGVYATAITILTAEETLGVSFPPQAVGSYSVVLSNCGRTSAPSPTITVTPPSPTITSFMVSPSTMDFCDGPFPNVLWAVENAQTVAVTVSNQLILGPRGANPCGTSSGHEFLPYAAYSQPGTGPVIYTLEATSPWTSEVATQTATLTRVFATPTVSRVTIFNQSGGMLVLWVLVTQANGQAGGVYFGSFNDSQSKIVTAFVCQTVTLVAVDPVLVEKHNQDFDDNLKTTDLMTAQNSRFWRWSLISRFHGSAPAISASIL